jgi:hypothetical protein
VREYPRRACSMSRAGVQRLAARRAGSGRRAWQRVITNCTGKRTRRPARIGAMLRSARGSGGQENRRCMEWRLFRSLPCGKELGSFGSPEHACMFAPECSYPHAAQLASSCASGCSVTDHCTVQQKCLPGRKALTTQTAPNHRPGCALRPAPAPAANRSPLRPADRGGEGMPWLRCSCSSGERRP